MKTLDQINHARKVVREKALTPGLSKDQTTLLAGMLNALVWVADGPAASTMERLLAGEPLAPGQTASNVLETVKASDDPLLMGEALGLLLMIRNRNGCTPQMVQHAERILRAAGHGVRQG